MVLEKIYQTEVITALPETPLTQISRLMQEKNVGCIVIIDKNTGYPKPVGILTDRDIALQIGTDEENIQKKKAEEIMHKDLLTFKKNQTLKEALIEMRKKAVRRALIVDEEDKLLGIVSADDLLCYNIDLLKELNHLIKHQISKTHCAE